MGTEELTTVGDAESAPRIEAAALAPRPGLVRRTVFNRFSHLRGGWRLLLYLAGVALFGIMIPAASTGLGGARLWPIAAFDLFLGGIVFAQLYLFTARLWLPIGLHLSWNWTLSCFWGFDVSGIELGRTLFVATPQGSKLLTGGGFGLEGSILTTTLLLVLIFVLPHLRSLRPSAAMTSLWAPYPRGFNLGPAVGEDR
jgi:hypothetical protein